MQGPVLELSAGEPGWYAPAAAVLFCTVIAALVITPLMHYYTITVLSVAGLILWRIWRQRKGRARYTELRIYPDFAVALLDGNGDEIPVDYGGQAWVSPWIIVLPLRLASGVTERIVVARDLNDPDAFRRFRVMCRFGFAVDRSGGHNVSQSTNTGA